MWCLLGEPWKARNPNNPALSNVVAQVWGGDARQEAACQRHATTRYTNSCLGTPSVRRYRYELYTMLHASNYPNPLPQLFTLAAMLLYYNRKCKEKNKKALRSTRGLEKSSAYSLIVKSLSQNLVSAAKI